MIKLYRELNSPEADSIEAEFRDLERSMRMVVASATRLSLPPSNPMALLAMTEPLPRWAVAPRMRMGAVWATAGVGD